jgi:hypothetical protein
MAKKDFYEVGKHSPGTWCVWASHGWGTGHRECVSMHSTKRGAQAAANKLVRKGVGLDGCICSPSRKR